MTTEKDENFEKLINDLETTYGEFYPECGVDRAVNAIENFGKFFNEAEKKGEKFLKYDNQTFDINDREKSIEKFLSFLNARARFKKSFTFQNKKYSTESCFSPEEQIANYGNLNREINESKDETSAAITHKIAGKNIDDDPRIPFSDKDKYIEQKLNRYYDIIKACGTPGIYPQSSSFNPVVKIGSAASKNPVSGMFVPNILGSGGNIYLSRRDISNERTFVAELAHAFRNKHNQFGEAAQFVGDGLKDIFRMRSLGFTPDAQMANYDDVGKMEYDAHNIVEPILQEYISGNIQTISQIHYKIESLRKNKKYSYSQTSDSNLNVLQGKIDFLDDAIKEYANTEAAETLLKAREETEKQLKEKKKNLAMRQQLRRSTHTPH